MYNIRNVFKESYISASLKAFLALGIIMGKGSPLPERKGLPFLHYAIKRKFLH